MKNPKVIYILIGIFCFFALLAGIYAQFFVEDANKENIIVPNFNQEKNNPSVEKTQEELKAKLNSVFTNSFNPKNYDTSAIQKLNTEKELIYTAHHIEEQKENYEVKINLPVVNIKGEVPTSFNNITQTVFANKASEVLNHQGTNKIIYTVNYAAFINEDILSLAIQSTLKEGNNPQRVIIQTYNYNLKTGEKVELTDMLAQKNVIQSEAQKKINNTVKKAGEEAKALVQSGYTVYNRELSNQMYQVANVATYFLAQNGELYIIFAYGNNNFTSEMDIIWYE